MLLSAELISMLESAEDYGGSKTGVVALCDSMKGWALHRFTGHLPLLLGRG